MDTGTADEASPHRCTEREAPSPQQSAERKPGTAGCFLLTEKPFMDIALTATGMKGATAARAAEGAPIPCLKEPEENAKLTESKAAGSSRPGTHQPQKRHGHAGRRPVERPVLRRA
jgi:hypothetical protein